jgi:hypothetical protein
MMNALSAIPPRAQIAAAEQVLYDGGRQELLSIDVRSLVMSDRERTFLHRLLQEAVSAVIVSAALALALLWTDALGIGSLVAGRGEESTAIIFVLGGVTTLTPVLLAVAIACGRGDKQ